MVGTLTLDKSIVNGDIACTIEIVSFVIKSSDYSSFSSNMWWQVLLLVLGYVHVSVQEQESFSLNSTFNLVKHLE